MKQYLILISISVFIVYGCSSSSHENKNTYCFLDDLNISNEDKIVFLSDSQPIKNTDELDYQITVSPCNKTIRSIQEYNYLIIRKADVNALSENINLSPAALDYEAENLDYIIYKIRSTHKSKYFGNVHCYKECSINVEGKVSKGFHTTPHIVVQDKEKQFLRFPETTEFPITLQDPWGYLLDASSTKIESFIAIKTAKSGAEIALIRNFKSDLNISLDYKSFILKNTQDDTWKGFNHCFDLLPGLTASDQNVMYLINQNNIDFDLKSWEVNIVDNHKGTSRFYGKVISSFSWYKSHIDSKWSKASGNSQEGEVHFENVKKGGTAFHYYAAASELKIKKGDHFYVEYDVKNPLKNYSTILHILIQNAMGEEIKSYTTHLVQTENRWQHESFNTIIDIDLKADDRIMIWFQNQGEHPIDITAVSGSIVRKHYMSE